MKRNLSSHAIKAMAIAMSVAMGTTTAISGVVTGTVVNAYAAVADTHNQYIDVEGATKAELKVNSDNVDIVLTIKSDQQAAFGVKADGTAQANAKGFVLTTKASTESSGNVTIFDGTEEVGTVTADTTTLTISIPKANLSSGLTGAGQNLYLSYDPENADTTNKTAQIDTSNRGAFTEGTDLQIKDLVISNKDVDNTAPTLEATGTFKLEGNTITLTASEPLAALGETNNDSSNFEIKKDGGDAGVTIQNFKVDTTTDTNIVLTLSDKPIDGKYTINYKTAHNGLKDKANNELATKDGITVQVTGEEAAQGPTINNTESKIEETDATKLTLTFNENIKVKNEDNKPAPTDFTVLVNDKPNVVTKLSDLTTTASGKTLDLTLTDRVYKNDVVKVYYKNNSGNAIINESSEELQEITQQDAIQITNSTTTERPVEKDNFVYTVGTKTYTFEKTTDNSGVALVSFNNTGAAAKSTNVTKFENGIIETASGSFKLTQIGNGTDPLTTITSADLAGQTNNVTTIKASAFSGNDKVTDLSFPVVTLVEQDAFKDATKLANIDLGSASSGLQIKEGALAGTSALTGVTTSKANEQAVTTAAKESDSEGIKVVTDETLNDKNATIKEDRFYQTTDGLRFKGLSGNTLSFEGNLGYIPVKPGQQFNGDEDQPYLVTYDKETSKVTIQAGSEVTPVEKMEITDDSNNTLSFEKVDGGVALISVKNASGGFSAKQNQNKLENGVLHFDNQTYNLVQLGTGNTMGDFDASTVLQDDLKYVTKVSANAFNGNTQTETLTLPAVTYIGANAFNGTTTLTTLNLGNSTNITFEDNALVGMGSSGDGSGVTVTTNSTIPENATGEDTVSATNPAPTVTKAVVTDANTITLTLSEPVYTELDASGIKALFTVKSGAKGSESQNNIESVTIGSKQQPSNTITIKVETAITWSDTVKYAYTGDDTTKQIKDTTDIETGTNQKALAGIPETEITESNIQKPEKAPVTVKEAKSNSATDLVVKFNENILKNGDVGADGFELKKEDNVTITPESVVVSNNNTITFTLPASSIEATTGNIKLAYKGGNNKLVTTDDPVKIVGEFNTNVINTQDPDAPVLSDLTATHTQNTITITAEEYLTPKEITGDGGFTLVGDGTNVTGTAPVTAVKVEGKTIVLTIDETQLTGTGTEGHLKIKYTKPAEKENQISDTNGNIIDTDTSGTLQATLTIHPAEVYALRTANVPYNVSVREVDGNITIINSVANTDIDTINSMLTPNLTKISANAFNGINNETLNFANVSSTITIENGAFSGTSGLTLDLTNMQNAGNLNISASTFSGATGLNISATPSDAQALARKLGSNSGITINNDKPEDIINKGDGGSSGGGSSTGGSAGGGGANIGTVNTDNNNGENNNNNNNNQTVVEDKELSFDVISLPSVTGEAKVFSDVAANYWAKPHIDKLSTAGIINGDQNGNFNPNGQTKRADVTIMLVNLLGLTPETNNKFVDVNPNAYYAPYVGTASSYGIVNGSNGMFNPEGVISRQDTMVMIAQILKGLNLNVNTDNSSLAQFSDANNISSYAQESVAILVNSGIITGNNGKLNPTNPVTRAEMATIMSKLYDVLDSANK